VRKRDTFDNLCAKLEQILIAHRVRTIKATNVISDLDGHSLLTIDLVERAVIAWLIGDRHTAAAGIRALAEIHAAYQVGRLKPIPTRFPGRSALIVDTDGSILLDISDARSASEILQFHVEAAAA
jgi:hypothetical protein